jgi:hypothetical protein
VNQFDAFAVFWCTMVGLIVVVNVAWAVNDLKRGSARMHFWGFGERVSREEEPFEFWIAVGSKLIVLPIGSFMIWFAMDMFKQ